MNFLILILSAMLDFVPAGQAYLKPLQQRDSILIADQIEYGWQLDTVKAGTQFAFQDFSKISNDTLTLVRGWQIDTLKTFRLGRKDKTPYYSLKGSIVIAPFEEGRYELPPLTVLRNGGGSVDTLLFEAQALEVKTMPVDTATFEIHDIKGQMGYPLTFKEVLPWILGALLLAALVAAVVAFVRRRRAGEEAQAQKDPAYVVALRQLEKFRSNKYWAPEKQKAFYSGITDTLKTYIEDRFGVDAPEMTTAELFDALKGNKDLTPELYSDAKDLFERADFVKFAKHYASDEENASAVPVAVRFVTSTYQTQLEEEPKTEDVL